MLADPNSLGIEPWTSVSTMTNSPTMRIGRTILVLMRCLVVKMTLQHSLGIVATYST